MNVEQLFVEYEHPIGRFLVQMVGDRQLAEDLLQDCFHDAVRGRRQLDDALSPVAWLFGIARNHALRALRRRRRHQRLVELLGHRGQRSASDSGHDLIALRDLLERTLSSEDRALVFLRHLHGFNSNELARITGRSPEAVRQRLSRAQTALLKASDPGKEE